MIKFINLSNDPPFKIFKDYFDNSLLMNQDSIDAISVASYCYETKKVDSRFVNLKFIIKDKFIFFSNYKSPKAKQFAKHPNVAINIFWDKLNVQIRMNGNIKKTSRKFSDEYFYNRSTIKNALSISSKQSHEIKSYNQVIRNYESYLESPDIDLQKRPDYWGGFSFCPYYFEFWEGHKSRINKRDVFELANGCWKNRILQP